MTDIMAGIKTNMIGIVDYKAGNIASVGRALKFLKAQYIISSKTADLAKCQKLIFPGVGDAGYAMDRLKMLGLDVFLRDFVANPQNELLGICLGSQVLFDYSAEGNTQCLGLLKGVVQHFESVFKNNGLAIDLKIPHIGWNDIKEQNSGHPLLQGLFGADFYFVHSYIICPTDETVTKATADYGVQVPACVAKDNICAFQFHPEKSGKAGLLILQRFLEKGIVQKEGVLC